LEAITNREFGADAKAWVEWLTRAQPELAEKLGGADGVDVAAWKKRLAGIRWESGKPEAGKKAFEKASCAACHNGAAALGPDLTGVGKRFSRDDLLTAIVRPSQDVPARYRATRIATTDGKAYEGVVIYESVDGLILQTGPAATVRLAGSQIESRAPSEVSIMPAGLLDPLSDREIADLVAYLKTLGEPPAKP
jgi:putative heme-binding domain-containing protein